MIPLSPDKILKKTDQIFFKHDDGKRKTDH